MSIFEKYGDLLDEDYVELYDLRNSATARDLSGPIMDLDVAVALLRFHGNFTLVAKELKRGRRTIENYVMREPNLLELAEDIQEEFLDMAEEKVKALTLAGDPATVRYILSTLGKKRGYVTRLEATGKDGGALDIQFFLPDNGRDDTYQEDGDGNSAD